MFAKQPVGTVMRLLPACASSRKEVGSSRPLASVQSWGLGSSRGFGVGGKSEKDDPGRPAGQNAVTCSVLGPEPVSAAHLFRWYPDLKCREARCWGRATQLG